MRNLFTRRNILLVLGALAGILVLAACNVSTTTASLGFIVGTGGAYDSKVHKIVYPGQQAKEGSYEKTWYVPGNSRNFIVNDGTVRDANGTLVGDRTSLIVATTKDNTNINVWVSAFWMLNQSEESLLKFWEVCLKYRCASDKDISGNINNSTEGWNDMLGENFGPALDGAARLAAIEVSDAIWKTHSPKLYQDLADGMSNNFADVVRARLGYKEDLFCGSQNSFWESRDQPGKGKFHCSPVRIVVERVERAKDQTNESTQSVKVTNAQALENAQARYGPDAGYWLGIQDTIEKCKGASVNCIVSIGGSGGGPAVSVPTKNIAPTPAPTPAKR